MTELTPGQWAWRPMTRFAQFSGRAPRAEYWWFYLATLVIGFALELLEKPFGDNGYLGIIFNVITIIPTIAVTVRRLHDIEKSGWWLAAFAVTFAPLGYFAFMTEDAQPDFGGMTAVGIISVIIMIILGLTLLVFTLTRGTEGPNRYGDDPYGPDRLEEVFA